MEVKNILCLAYMCCLSTGDCGIRIAFGRSCAIWFLDLSLFFCGSFRSSCFLSSDYNFLGVRGLCNHHNKIQWWNNEKSIPSEGFLDGAAICEVSQHSVAVWFYFFSAFRDKSILYLYADKRSLKLFGSHFNSVDMCMLSLCSVFCDHATILKIQTVIERAVSWGRQ